MASNVQIVRDFIDCWSRLDPAEISSYFTDDGTYFNIPAQPVTGRDNIESFIRGFTESWSATEWQILNVAADGDIVYCERLDKTRTANGDVDLPCMGVFEMRGGKIHIWRDYFDMSTFLKAMGR